MIIFKKQEEEMAKNNKITAEQIVKYYKCGDYHGRRRDGFEVNAEETSFGIYAYFINNMFGLSLMDKEELKDPYYQCSIDTICAMLDDYVMKNCIDSKNSTVKFSRYDFEATFENFTLPNAKHRFVSDHILMPYVVHYVLMQHGIRLRNENFFLETDFVQDEFSGQEITKKNPKVYASETMKSIDEKMKAFDFLMGK